MVSEEINVYSPQPIKIRFKGQYDFDKVYSVMRKWFKKNRIKWYENLYKDKPSAFEGREIEQKIYGDYKRTEYFKHTIKITTHTWEQTEKQVVVNGKKKKIAEGKIHITINGSVIADYKGKFPKYDTESSLGEKVYAIFGKILFSLRKNEIIMKEFGYLAPMLEELSNELKIALGMESKL